MTYLLGGLNNFSINRNDTKKFRKKDIADHEALMATEPSDSLLSNATLFYMWRSGALMANIWVLKYLFPPSILFL
jgi:hypothetical protein